MTPEQVKAENERALKARGIPVRPGLPPIADPSEWRPPSPTALGKRCLILSAAFCRVFGAPQAAVRAWLEREDLLDSLSGNEMALFRSTCLPRRDLLYFEVQVECLWELGWVGGFVDELDHFSECPEHLARLIPKPGQETGDFRRSIHLRPEDDILREADFLYRLHWAVRDASVRGAASPVALPGYVSEQRLRAINWVLNSRQDWDRVDVST